MPRQPLYNEGSAVRTNPGEGMPRASAGGGRGVAIDSAALHGAINPALLDDSGAIAEGRGYAALGAGIADVGDAFSGLARAQAVMRNENMVNQAKNIISESETELAEEWLKEGDEMKWMGLSEQKAQAVQSRLAGLNLSRAAKDEVESVYSSWRMKLMGETRLNSARKTRGDFETDKNDSLKAARMNGDTARADRIVHEKAAALGLPPGTVELELAQNKEAEAAAINKQKAENLKTARNTVIEAVKLHGLEGARTIFREDGFMDGKLDPEEKESLEDVARGVHRDMSAETLGKVTDGIVSGDIWNEYELDATFGHDPVIKNASPALRKQLLDDIKAYKSVEAQKAAKEIRESDQGVKNFYDAYGRANDWKPNFSTPEGMEAAERAYAHQKSWVRMNVRGEHQVGVNRILESKFSPTGGKKAGEKTEVTQVVRARIARIYTAERTAAAAHLEKITKPVEKWVDGKRTEVPNQGPADDGYKAAQKRLDGITADQFNVDKGMEDFWNKNPQFRDNETESIKHLNTLLPAGKIIRDAEAIGGDYEGILPPPGAVATPKNAPPEPDDVLPDSPAPQEDGNILISAAPPQDLEPVPADGVPVLSGPSDGNPGSPGVPFKLIDKDTVKRLAKGGTKVVTVWDSKTRTYIDIAPGKIDYDRHYNLVQE